MYNEDPGFKLDNPAEFIAELLQYLSNNEPGNEQIDLSNILPCLESLTNVVKNNAGLEANCNGKFRLFTRFLMHSADLEQPVLSLLTCLMANQSCVSQVVGMGIIPALLVVSTKKNVTSTALMCIACLSMVVTHPQVVKEAIQKGEKNYSIVIKFFMLLLHLKLDSTEVTINLTYAFTGSILYLLDLFCSTNIDPAIRQKSSEVISKLSADKLSGPRVKILLSKFLPSIFCEAMTESPASAVQLFDSNTENPEIVWNDNTRANVTACIQDMKQELYLQQRKDLSADWRLPSESFQVEYGVQDELVIGGIYLRIYVSNPSWNIRKPREFLRDLLEFAFSPAGASKSEDNIDLVGSALGHLLNSQPHLCDGLPPTGHLNKMLNALQSDRVPLQRVASIILRHASVSHACLEALSRLECVQPLTVGIKRRTETLSLTCEAVNHLFAAQHPELVSQALQCQLIPLLLDLLKSSSAIHLGSSPAATKAHIVHALQHMAQNERHGQEVQDILAKSDIWAQYRDQVCILFVGFCVVLESLFI